MGRVKVKSVVEKDSNSSVNPILVKFEHAPVRPDVDESLDLNRVFGTAVFETDMSTSTSRDMSHLNRSAFENRSTPSGKETKSGTKRKQVVALQSDAMTYLGTRGFDIPSLPASTDDMMKTYVALKDKKKLRIFEVTPITVSPYLKGHSHVLEEDRDTGVEKTKLEKQARATDLIKAFGSKKKRLAYERQEKNKIDISDMQESMDAAIGNLEVPSSEPVIKDESVLTLLPPCNRAATAAQDVYDLEDILSSEELDAMDDLVEAFLDASSRDMKKWKESKTYSDYFLAMWNRFQSKPHDPRAIRNAKIVLYTEFLIMLMKLKHEFIRKKNVELPKQFPLWMREKVLDNFTILNANGTRNRPDNYKDKTCCYIMVLALLANDLYFDVQLMSTSLNIHIKKLLALARAVGITVTYNAASKEYRGVLKLPLPKPIEYRGRRKTLR